MANLSTDLVVKQMFQASATDSIMGEEKSLGPGTDAANGATGPQAFTEVGDYASWCQNEQFVDESPSIEVDKSVIKEIEAAAFDLEGKNERVSIMITNDD